MPGNTNPANDGSQIAPLDDGAHIEFEAWFDFEVLAPLGIVVLAWVIAQFIIQLPHPVVGTFGSGDLLPVAALILLGSAAEVDAYSRIFPEKRRKLARLFRLQLLLALLIAVVFGAVKGKALQLLDQPLNKDGEHLLSSFTFVTIALAVFAISFAYYAKKKLLSMQLESQLQALAGS